MKGRTDEEVTVFGRADHRHPEGAGGGLPVAELCRKHGMSEASFYTWKAKYGGLDVSEAKRLRGLEAENAKLKRLLAEAMLDNAALKDLRKKVVTPAGRREAATYLQAAYEMSERRACAVIGVDRSSARYESSKPDDGVLRARLKALAQERRRFGYRRLHVLLRREGHAVNRKRVQRIYREEKLTVRRRGGRKRAIGTRAPLDVPRQANERWSLDFVSDQMTDGRRSASWRWSTTPRASAWHWCADTSLSGARVARELDAIVAWRGKPAEHRQRQRHGADVKRHPGLVGPNRRQMALHRSRQAAAERLHRELQRPYAGRGAERDPVPLARPCACRAGCVASRLQRATAALEARLDDAQHLRCSPIRHRRPDRSATGKLRDPASCDGITLQIRSTADSSSALDEKRGSRHRRPPG